MYTNSSVFQRGGWKSKKEPESPVSAKFEVLHMHTLGVRRCLLSYGLCTVKYSCYLTHASDDKCSRRGCRPELAQATGRLEFARWRWTHHWTITAILLMKIWPDALTDELMFYFCCIKSPSPTSFLTPLTLSWTLNQMKFTITLCTLRGKWDSFPPGHSLSKYDVKYFLSCVYDLQFR